MFPVFVEVDIVVRVQIPLLPLDLVFDDLVDVRVRPRHRVGLRVYQVAEVQLVAHVHVDTLAGINFFFNFPSIEKKRNSFLLPITNGCRANYPIS